MSSDSKNVVVALIKNTEGKYLLLRLAHYPGHKNEWCPVAGHCKAGETVNEAIIREVKEELNVIAKPIRQVSEWEQDILGEKAFWWEVEISGNINIDNKEIIEIGWFSVDEIKNLKLWPATQKFFEKFVWGVES